MDTKLTLNYRILIIGIPLLIVSFIGLLVNSELYVSHLTIPATLDLILTTPLIYFLLIRKKKIPKITVISVFILSLILASYIIPAEDQNILIIVKTYALPMVELGVASYVLWKARQIYMAFHSLNSDKPDFYDIIFQVTSKILPTPINGLLATEIAVIYYSIFNWSKKLHYANNEYSYHRKSGIFSVLYALMGLATVELMAVHMLISKYSHLWAWIATALTLYSLLQIFALIKSMSRRPIILNHDNNTLQLRYGFFSQTNFAIDQIKEIQLSRKSISEDDKETIPLSPLGKLDSHNMVFYLYNKHTLFGFYGRKKQFLNITVYADDHEQLFNDIMKSIN